MGENITDFEHYRELYDAQPIERHSLETLGITYQGAFEAAMADHRSVVMNVSERPVPVLTPLTNLPDRNMALYRGRAAQVGVGEIGDVYHYSHLGPEHVDDAAITAMAPAWRALAATRSVIAYDCAPGIAERTDAELQALLRRMGGIGYRLAAGMPAHYHYVMRLGVPEGYDGEERQLDFQSLYDGAVACGLITDSAIEIAGALSDQDCDHIADYYARRHMVLTHSDATEAGFSPESLQRILTDPRYVKVSHRFMGQIANLALLADPRNCSWIDQTYLRASNSDHYEGGRIVVGIGAVSDPEAPNGLARKTFRTVMRLIAYAGGNAVLAIATDDESNRYIPRLSADAARRAGLRPQPEEPVTGVAFRAAVLHLDS